MQRAEAALVYHLHEARDQIAALFPDRAGEYEAVIDDLLRSVERALYD